MSATTARGCSISATPPPGGGRRTGEALPPAPRPTPILGMEILSDGNALVTMRITLPADRGAVLFRTLLDFGVTGT